ncbi:hypothetical protein BDZ91DRAFT_782512 [Kalaharituber pfeilii]|nr:hypothetical protein BDZ91DRAFT_782512 [Kalaharituber pfeilii]
MFTKVAEMQARYQGEPEKDNKHRKRDKHHTNLSDEPDFTQIGQLLGMAGKLDSTGVFSVQQLNEEQHVDAVKDLLTVKNNTEWLLVFDNLYNVESFNINDYIPSSAHGAVIITSRRCESMQGRMGLEVQQKDNREEVELLFNSAKQKFLKPTPGECDCESEKEAAASSVRKLGYLPLAIVQAGAYIHICQILFSRYLPEAVFAAWDLSFNAIKIQNPRAAESSLLCGLRDNNDINEELLRRGMKLSTDDTALGHSIQILFSYSIAKRQDRDDSFSIHPLIHMWTQWKLEIEPERYKKATEAFLMVVSAITNDPTSSRTREVENWVFERRILPHIIAVEKLIKTLATVCAKLVYYTVIMGKPERGVRIYWLEQKRRLMQTTQKPFIRSLAGKEKAPDADHPEALDTVHNMAWVQTIQIPLPRWATTSHIFYRRGQYNKALELYQRALAGTGKALGTNYPDTLVKVNDMARVFYQQEQYEKALGLYERVLAGKEEALGADHPNTVATVNNMAKVFYRQGQYSKALELYQRALAGQEKAFSADHPDTLVIINNMAQIFQEHGQYSKALELYERALAGKEHGQYSKALELYERALAGKEHGQYSKALELYERALAGKEKALGADNPDTLITVRSMAALFECTGQSDKARELRERASRGMPANAGI